MSLVQAFAAVAQRQPSAPAITWRTSVWTYDQLMRAIALVRKEIMRRQVPRGTRAALLARNSPHYVAWYYGALAAGAVVVPLNPQERAAVLARQAAHSGAKLLVGDPQHPEWRDVCAALGHLPMSILDLPLVESGIAPVGHGYCPDPPEPAESVSSALASESHELATIMYTSGTTGSPKGVMLSNGNLHSNAAAIIDYLGLTPRDHGLCVLPLQFSYGNSMLHSHLLSGAQLTLEENFAYPRVVLERMQEEGITGFAGVPSTFALLLRHELQKFELRQLRYITQAGGAMAKSMITRLRERLPGTKIYIMYGQTEATARISYLPPERLGEKLGSVGIPIVGVEIDVRRGYLPAGPGASGEIWIRGPNVMLGYWENPTATAEALRDGWLRTGDLGHRDQDGYLYIDGRAVEMIKVGAFRVSPQEVEEVIADLTGVEEVAVTGIPDEIQGQVPKAVVVSRPSARLDITAVKAHCRRHLATYKIPKVVEFRSALPKTTSGKVQRLKLARELP